MVDEIWEPMMAQAPANGLTAAFFGIGKGSGASVMMLLLGILGTGICLLFGRILKKYK